MSDGTWITYFGSDAFVICDRNCGKAWGINSRPRIQLSGNEDDFVFLADGELGEAPADPGTHEGLDGKPASPAAFPNKWCVRECERCMMSDSDSATPPSFESRVYNIPGSAK